MSISLGKFLARVEWPRTGNVLLRRTQHRIADDPARAVPIVRGIVTAMAANQRTVLRRALRDHGPGRALDARAASERSVKHWFAGSHAPRGRHLIALMRNSNPVLTRILVAAGRGGATCCSSWM